MQVRASLQCPTTRSFCNQINMSLKLGDVIDRHSGKVYRPHKVLGCSLVSHVESVLECELVPVFFPMNLRTSARVSDAIANTIEKNNKERQKLVVVM